MAATPSRMLELGTLAPDFSLKSTEGKTITLKTAKGPKGLLVAFICNHCPYVIHIQKELAKVTKDAMALGVGVVGINSNDVEKYPADSPEKMAQTKGEIGYTFPYLFDSTQAVAKAFQAACTPDFFLFDKEMKLVYRGQFDESRPGRSIPVTGKDLVQAITAVAKGTPVLSDQRPSLGCNIKWKPGNEPSL